MPNRGKRQLKLAMALAVTALALTGFAPERGGHGGHSSHGGGGGSGCSSSHSDHDSSSSSNDYGSSSSGSSGATYGDDDVYEDDDTYGSSTSGGSYTRRPTHRSTTSSPGGSSTSRLKDAKVKLVSCATTSKPYATVQVTNDNQEKARFTVSVTFKEANGLVVTQTDERVEVSGKGRKTARIEMDDPSYADSVDHCEADPYAPAASGS